MTTPRTPRRPNAIIDKRWCAIHGHVMGTPLPDTVTWSGNVPCDVQSGTAALKLANPADEKARALGTIDLDAVPSAPVAHARYGQVLHGIRALLAFIAFLLATLVVLAVATAMGAVPPAPSSLPTSVQLVIPAERDPAAEAMGHLIYADGTEHDVTAGTYSGDIVGVRFQVAAGDDGTTGCRILVNNARVAEEVAFAGEVTMCSWNAP